MNTDTNTTCCVIEVRNGVERIIYKGSRLDCNRIKSDRKSRIPSKDSLFHDYYIESIESRKHHKLVASLYETYEKEYPEHKRVLEEKDGRVFDVTWIKYKKEHIG